MKEIKAYEKPELDSNQIGARNELIFLNVLVGLRMFTNNKILG